MYFATHSSSSTPAPIPTATAIAARTFTLSGTFTLTRGAFSWSSSDTSGSCRGFNGFDDIYPGTPVVVTDQAGTVIATGQLLGGRVTMDTVDATRADSCQYQISVPGIPAGKTFYGVEVSHRGKQTLTPAEAEGGQLNLTLG